MRNLGSTMKHDRQDCRSRKSHKPTNLIAFPLARNARLIEELVDDFLAIPKGKGRLPTFRRKVLGDLARRRRALGLSPEIVEAELEEIEAAMAERLWQMFPTTGGAA